MSSLTLIPCLLACIQAQAPPARIALLVGVEKYAPGTPESVTPLEGCRADVLAVQQTLVGQFGFAAEDVRILLKFSAQLVAFFTLLALVLFHTRLRETILISLIGLTPELASYAEPALAISFAMAAFWGCTALFRGLLAKALTTGSLAASGLLRIATAAATSSIAIANPDINGAALGTAAWILSYAVETAVSTWRLRRLGWYVER